MNNNKLNFGKRNYLILVFGVLIITIGYLVMNIGDNFFSPILLVIGYCVLIPVSLLVPPKKK